MASPGSPPLLPSDNDAPATPSSASSEYESLSPAEVLNKLEEVGLLASYMQTKCIQQRFCMKSSFLCNIMNSCLH